MPFQCYDYDARRLGRRFLWSGFLLLDHRCIATTLDMLHTSWMTSRHFALSHAKMLTFVLYPYLLFLSTLVLGSRINVAGGKKKSGRVFNNKDRRTGTNPCISLQSPTESFCELSPPLLSMNVTCRFSVPRPYYY
ncbi:hypothetical protein L210DRAFT_3559124 [Boletus edulis BED1]|uniref:Uncharacterized protein n=1 Tax=Boletus edulis BED1 TaxID=1328754 RepID=A0AAD4G9U7_BOLED|nr:hypothetical protein L210DRAFT_3559124 [Boletus edulis BED1]